MCFGLWQFVLFHKVFPYRADQHATLLKIANMDYIRNCLIQETMNATECAFIELSPAGDVRQAGSQKGTKTHLTKG